jgi:hypothetical protein
VHDMRSKATHQSHGTKKVAQKIVCPHCGADLMKRVDKPPPEGPSIGRKYSRAEIEAEAKQPKRAKANRDGTMQFKG